MQTLDICDADLAHLYCPICGTHTLDPGNQKPTQCDHLLYVTCSDTPDDPWFTRDDIPVEIPDDSDSIPQALAKRFPESEKLLFLLSSPAPAGLEVYVLYSHR